MEAQLPCRIVCLTEETTETLYRIGEADRIVGISGFTVRPQNQKSSVAGSPTGHLQVRSVNSIRLIFFEVFSTSRTDAKASGEISFADGCGGNG